jgi:catechol 2,3-dioxygenase-like lactoylglutathione lyase family enzyme
MVTLTATYIAKKISPMLAAADMEETLAFYREVLGFESTMKSAEYAIIERDGRTIHFMKAASEEVMKCVRGHTEIYIEVSGLGALWEHVKTFKERYRIRDLFERDYGMTEFHIEDPNGCLVFVGEPTGKIPAARSGIVGRFDARALYTALDERRRAREMSWQQAAREVGVSATTMTRTKLGGRMEVDGMLAMVRWVGRTVESFTRGGTDRRGKTKSSS